MQIYQRKLSNGLRIQAVAIPGTKVVTTLILAGAGSRYEDPSIAGLSHFLEHMFFKGAQKYTTPKAVAEAVDSFGGEFNAFTGKEYAGYYVKSGAENIEKACDVLSDMLIHSRFDPAEIDKERGVILEEMAMYLDAPMYQISWDFERLVFGDQPLGRDQIGTKEVIRTVKQEDFFEYQKSLYVPSNMVITVAGNVSEETLDILEKYFVFPSREQTRQRTPFDFDLPTEKYKIRNKKTEQYHISLGVRTPAESHPDYPVLKVLAVILGGNMSARMFQNVREEKGLCYSIRTQVDEYTDTGLMTTRAGVKLDDVLRAVEAIRYEYDKMREHGAEIEEVEKAINYLCGKSDLTTEDTEDIAHHYGKDQLLYNKTEHFEEWKARLRSVKKEQVDALARDILRPENLRFGGIGPQIDEEKLLRLLS